MKRLTQYRDFILYTLIHLIQKERFGIKTLTQCCYFILYTLINLIQKERFGTKSF